MTAPKQIFRSALLTGVFFLLAMFPAFGQNAQGEIALVTEFAGEVQYFFLAGSGEALIDWGDGSPEEKITLKEDFDLSGSTFSHNYQSGEKKTLVVRGNITHFSVEGFEISVLDVSGCPALRSLNCGKNKLSSLDIRSNAALTVLLCHRNSLTALDVSQNSALRFLDCDNNNMNKAALLDLVHALPDRSGKEKSPLFIFGNPGTREMEISSDITIAERKNWGDER